MGQWRYEGRDAAYETTPTMAAQQTWFSDIEKTITFVSVVKQQTIRRRHCWATRIASTSLSSSSHSFAPTMAMTRMAMTLTLKCTKTANKTEELSDILLLTTYKRPHRCDSRMRKMRKGRIVSFAEDFWRMVVLRYCCCLLHGYCPRPSLTTTSPCLWTLTGAEVRGLGAVVSYLRAFESTVVGDINGR